MMVELTIYTDRFDSRENVYGRKGMSGKVFLDIIGGKEDGSGQEFNSLDEALEYAWENDVRIDGVLVNYLASNGVQMFKRFNIAPQEMVNTKRHEND